MVWLEYLSPQGRESHYVTKSLPGRLLPLIGFCRRRITGSTCSKCQIHYKPGLMTPRYLAPFLTPCFLAGGTPYVDTFMYFHCWHVPGVSRFVVFPDVQTESKVILTADLLFGLDSPAITGQPFSGMYTFGFWTCLLSKTWGRKMSAEGYHTPSINLQIQGVDGPKRADTKLGATHIWDLWSISSSCIYLHSGAASGFWSSEWLYLL